MSREIGSLFRVFLWRGTKGRNGSIPQESPGGAGVGPAGGGGDRLDSTAEELVPHPLDREKTEEIFRRLEEGDSLRKTQSELTRTIASAVAMQHQVLAGIREETRQFSGTARRLATLEKAHIACLKGLKDELRQVTRAESQARLRVLEDLRQRSRRSDILGAVIACSCLLLPVGGILLVLLA